MSDAMYIGVVDDIVPCWIVIDNINKLLSNNHLFLDLFYEILINLKSGGPIMMKEHSPPRSVNRFNIEIVLFPNMTKGLFRLGEKSTTTRLQSNSDPPFILGAEVFIVEKVSRKRRGRQMS
ncbi:hypothetical protein ACFE04_026213 [Oxalis oulophora]